MTFDDLLKMIDEIKNRLIAVQMKNKENPNEDIGKAIYELKILIDKLLQ